MCSVLCTLMICIQHITVFEYMRVYIAHWNQYDDDYRLPYRVVYKFIYALHRILFCQVLSTLTSRIMYPSLFIKFISVACLYREFVKSHPCLPHIAYALHIEI